MKTIGWILVALATAFLLFIMYFGILFLFNSNIKTETKVLSLFLAVLALGTTIGRFVYVIRDLKKSNQDAKQ
jgi:divalent metal cation (Fe/Co/Zn/Cd) transporter